MKCEEKAILMGSGLIALAILASGVIISNRLARSLDEKNFWEGSGVPAISRDVQSLTQPLARISDNLAQWTRA